MQNIIKDIIKSKSMLVVVVFIIGISYVSAIPQDVNNSLSNSINNIELS